MLLGIRQHRVHEILKSVENFIRPGTLARFLSGTTFSQGRCMRKNDGKTTRARRWLISATLTMSLTSALVTSDTAQRSILCLTTWAFRFRGDRKRPSSTPKIVDEVSPSENRSVDFGPLKHDKTFTNNVVTTYIPFHQERYRAGHQRKESKGQQ